MFDIKRKENKWTIFIYELIGTGQLFYGFCQANNNLLAGLANLLAVFIFLAPVSGAMLNPAQTFGNYVLAGNYEEDLEMFIIYSAAQYIGGFIGVAMSLYSPKAPVNPSHEIDALEWMQTVGRVHPRSFVCLGDCRWLQTFFTHLFVCTFYYFCCQLPRIKGTKLNKDTMLYGLLMITMLFSSICVGMPFWFAGSLNPAMSLASMLLMPEKKFNDGVGYNKFWLVYMVAPYLAGAISSYAHKFHAKVCE